MTLTASAASTRPPPTNIPASAPGQDSLRHQMPSTSSGLNVDAASANVSPIDNEMSSGRSAIASPIGNSATSPVASRKSRTRPGSTSVDTTPATLTSSPDVLDRNTENA